MRFCFLLTFLLGFISVLTWAQITSTQADSLRQVVKQYPKKDSMRVVNLINLGYALANSTPNEAIRYTNEGLQVARAINYAMGMAFAYRQLVGIYTHLGNYPKAAECAYAAIRVARGRPSTPTRDLFVASVYINLGSVQMNTGELDKAIVSFTNFLTAVDNHSVAQKDAEILRERNIALRNLGEVYARKRNFQKADSLLKLSLSTAEANRDYQLAAYVLSSWGLMFVNRKQPQRAVDLFKKGIVYAEIAGDLNVKSNLTGGLADMLFDLERYAESEKYSKQALALAKQLNLLELQREISLMLGYTYIAQKKSQQAISYLDSAKVLQDSLVSSDKLTQVARLEERFEREKQEAILNERHAAELEQQRTTRNFAISGIVLVLLALSTVFWFYTRQREARFKLQEADFKKKMAETELKVLRAQINPHFFFNALNSISSFVLKNDPFTADGYLSKFAHLMRTILGSAEHQEIPLSEDITALSNYLDLEQIAHNHRFSYRIDVDPELDPQRTLIPPLLLQPFVENSILHGFSKKTSDGLITINIHKNGDRLICSVWDNGIGRQKAAEINAGKMGRKSYGVALTQARIAILNQLKKVSGYVRISDLAEGTEVEVVLPLITN